MYQSTGTIQYNDYPCKLIVLVDLELVEYYRSMLPKTIRINRQMYPPHISVVRNEQPVINENWRLHEGEQIEFYYDGIIQSGKVYYWLNVFSKRLEEIRNELGLPVSSEYTRPPDEYNKCFHTTLGNLKNL